MLCVFALAGGAGIAGFGCGNVAGVHPKDAAQPPDIPISSGGAVGTGGVRGSGGVTGTGGVVGSGGAGTGGVVGSGGAGVGGTAAGGTGGSVAGGAGGTAAGGTGGAMAEDASADGARDLPGVDDSAAETGGSVGGTCGLPAAAASGMACDGEPRPAGELSGAVVETDCFSGLPNPTATLPTQGLEQVQCVLRQAPVGPAAERPARLGYRGMLVHLEGGKQVIELYQGAIIVREGANLSYQVDNGRALEQYLWCFVGVDLQD